MPHSHLNAFLNLGIALTYFLIPVGLFSIVVQGWPLLTPFFRLTLLKFALFIVLCGAGHLLESLMIEQIAPALAMPVIHAATLGISAIVALQMPAIAQDSLRFVREKRLADLKLSQSEAQFNAFLNCPKFIAWIKDETLKIIYVNQPLIELFGNLEGTRDRDRVPEVGHTTEKNDREVLATGKALEYIELVPTASGEFRQWLSYKFPIDLPHNRYVGGVAIDVTEREMLKEELEQTNQELEQFVYAASHDLRAPIRNIRGFVSILNRNLSHKLTPQEATMMEQIIKNCRYANSLVDGILQYSRIGRDDTPLEWIDLNELLGQICDRLSDAIEHSQSSIFWCELPVVLGVSTQLGQAFENLISNAIKYRLPQAPLEIFVYAEPTQTHWVFTVKDNGIGIDPEFHDQLFTMFRRLHTQDEIEGSGIGLATVKKIAELHGGNTWIESQGEGYGSAFKFSISKACDL